MQVAEALLREGGADITVQSQPECLTAMHLAARWGHVPVLELLVSHLRAGQPTPILEPAAPVQSAPEEKMPPVEATGQLKRLLGLKSAKGNTAIDEARAWGRPRCCEFLAGLHLQ